MFRFWRIRAKKRDYTATTLANISQYGPHIASVSS